MHQGGGRTPGIAEDLVYDQAPHIQQDVKQLNEIRVMENILLVACCLCIPVFTALVEPQDSPTIVETKSHSIFEGFFQLVRVRLKSLNPTMKE